MPGSPYQFGEFELDSARFELRRDGRVLKLERIPMELLLLLAEKQGAVVTRQEIIDRLWGKDVFVDTEHGINTAIRKIRQTLKDDPENPRFVQTVTGKGYRFVAETQASRSAEATSEEATAQSVEQSQIREAHKTMWGQPPRLSGGAELPHRSGSTARKPIFTALIVILIGILTFALRHRIFPSRAAQIHSIAVIPLANLSGDPSQDYFADGMTDELITALAKNRNLQVVSRTSSMQYKGVKRPLPDIARELNVDGILEGSVVRAANRVHMTVQLIYAPTDTHVWAESYDRDLNQAFLLPEELSETVAKQVKIAISPVSPPRYINPEAHDAYLHGHYLLDTYGAETISYFQKAIQLQPDYAAAWAGLVDAYILDGTRLHLSGTVSEKAHTAALKALELDPSAADAHASLSAWYLFFAWDPARAELEARRAIELDPNCVEGHHMLAFVYEVQMRNPEAEAELKRVAELDPYVHATDLADFYMNTRQDDAAFKELRLQHNARPNDADVVFKISVLYWLEGKYEESQKGLEQGFEMLHDPVTKAGFHQAWVRGGEPEVERWGMQHVLDDTRKRYVETEFVAKMMGFGVDKEATLKYLEISYRNHDPNLIFIQNEPVFNFLHSDPRYQALVKKMGLPLAS